VKGARRPDFAGDRANCEKGCRSKQKPQVQPNPPTECKEKKGAKKSKTAVDFDLPPVAKVRRVVHQSPEIQAALVLI
jgi:hypothetical protein